MKNRDGVIIWVEPNNTQCVEGAHWAARTLNNDMNIEYGYGDTANEAIGDLVGILTTLDSATIREIHIRDSKGEILYPVGR
jgi:hypothetical protein